MMKPDVITDELSKMNIHGYFYDNVKEFGNYKWWKIPVGSITAARIKHLREVAEKEFGPTFVSLMVQPTQTKGGGVMTGYEDLFLYINKDATASQTENKLLRKHLEDIKVSIDRALAIVG